MAKPSKPVAVCSQNTTFRQQLSPTIVAPNPASVDYYTYELPRTFLSLNQTTGGAAVTVRVDWATRMSAVSTVPEWLILQSIVLVPGGATPVNTLLTTGAVWLRFVVAAGAAGEVVEIAASSFV